MKKKVEHEGNQELEILKAVAQAWHGRSGSSRPTNEFDAYRRNFKSEPSRFKLEAMNKLSAKDNGGAYYWDFGESLFDSYEIVTVSKRLEAGLVLDNPFTGLDDSSRLVKRHKENSLKNLFNRMSAKRFNEARVPREHDDHF